MQTFATKLFITITIFSQLSLATWNLDQVIIDAKEVVSLIEKSSDPSYCDLPEEFISKDISEDFRFLLSTVQTLPSDTKSHLEKAAKAIEKALTECSE